MSDTAIVLAPTVAPQIALAPTAQSLVTLAPLAGTRGPAGDTGPPGAKGDTGSGGDLSQIFIQSIASATWVIPLSAPIISAGKVPAITVVDTGGTSISGFGWFYNSATNVITLTFTSAFIGVCHLN